jgi:hypothetical protein
METLRLLPQHGPQIGASSAGHGARMPEEHREQESFI